MPILSAATIYLAAMATTGAQDKPSSQGDGAAQPPAATIAVPGWKQPTPRPAGPGNWISQDDYPAAASRVGAEGVVGYRLAVDAAGRPATCRVLQSSRNADLDATTCDLLMRRSRFEPARDADDRPAPGTYESRVRWVLRDPLRPLPKAGEMIITLTAAPDGTVTDCSFTARGDPSNVPDPCKGARFAPQTGPDVKAQRVRFTTRVEYLDPQ